MAAEARMRVAVISPEATVFEGNASALVAPAWDGEMGVLPDHAPMVVLLGSGDLRIDAEAGQRTFRVSGGFMQVVDNTVTVLSERAEAT